MLPWKWPLYVQTLVAMVLGGIVGTWLGPDAAPLGQIAKWIVEVIKVLAIPLLFFAIFDAMAARAFVGKGVLTMFGISIGNALGAVTIGLGISNVFAPGKYLDLQHGSPLIKAGYKPPDTSSDHIVSMLVQSPMMLAIAAAVVLGLLFVQAQRIQSDKLQTQLARIGRWASQALRCVMWAMGKIVHLTPLAVFGAVARVLGEHGLGLLGGLAAYVGFCLLGMALHVAIVYHGWVVGAARIGLGRFWKAAREPVVYAFGINSSLATLPVTLKALDELGVSPGAARLSACVGTNFNNDGILLYEVVAVLFLAQAYGIEMPLTQQLVTALVCVAATIGVGGIPEAGIISLTLVLAAVHLPAEAIPLLLSVDWLVARCRSVVNVLGDMTVAVGIDVVAGRR